MNLILALKSTAAADILAGLKTCELRHRLPRQLRPGATIYLLTGGHIVGHCTFGGASTPPPAGILQENWLAAIAHAANITTTHAHYMLNHSTSLHAWHLRYPVPYRTPMPYTGPTVQAFKYTTNTPTITHPRLANFLLYLQTHHTPQ